MHVSMMREDRFDSTNLFKGSVYCGSDNNDTEADHTIHLKGRVATLMCFLLKYGHLNQMENIK